MAIKIFVAGSRVEKWSRGLFARLEILKGGQITQYLVLTSGFVYNSRMDLLDTRVMAIGIFGTGSRPKQWFRGLFDLRV